MEKKRSLSESRVEFSSVFEYTKQIYKTKITGNFQTVTNRFKMTPRQYEYSVKMTSPRKTTKTIKNVIKMGV